MGNPLSNVMNFHCSLRSTVLTLCLLPAVLHAATLEKSVQSALRDSPGIRKSIERARQAAEDIAMARSKQLPNVNVEASAGGAYRDRSVDGISTGTGDALLSRRAAVSLQQMLYDWGASGKLVLSARLRQVYEALLVEEARQEEALLVSETYLDIIGARLKLNIIADRINYLQKFYNKAAELKKAEADTQADIILGKLSNSRADFEKVRARADSLERRFELLTQHAPADLSLPASIPHAGDALTALDASPKLQAAGVSVEASRTNVEALSKDLFPTIYLEVTAGAGRDVAGIEGPDNELAAMAVFRWNPFDGGRKQAAIRKANAILAEDLAAVDDVRLAISDRVATAQAEHRGAERRYEALSKSINHMAEAVSNYETLFDKTDSKITPLSIVNVQSELNTARLDFVDAHIERFVQSYRVLAASGQLLIHLGVESPSPGNGIRLSTSVPK
jgi:adhesin transport system outer membrane protein